LQGGLPSGRRKGARHIPYKAKRKEVARESCGPGMPGPYRAAQISQNKKAAACAAAFLFLYSN
jgi:hypothetical protein